MNLILIGMPGAGKSTVGIILAKTLGLSFIDSDLVIQENTKRLLQEIIDTDGIDAFLEIEEEAVVGIDCRSSVIATGGSVVYSRKAMRHLKSLGKVIYLNLCVEEIEARLNNIKTRGVAMKSGQDIKGLYQERTPLYEGFADFTILCDGKNVEQIIEEIQEKFN